MSKYLPLALTVIGTVAAAVGLQGIVESHVVIYAVLTAVAQVLHAALPSVFGTGSGS